MSIKTVSYDSQMKALMYIRRPLSPPRIRAPITIEFLGLFYACFVANLFSNIIF